MKRIAIIISIIHIGVVSLLAQDTTHVQAPNRIAHYRTDGDCGCHNHPVNNYSGLNSLRARLANPSWDGKLGTLSTGLKLEDGRIKPLIDPSRKEDSKDENLPVVYGKEVQIGPPVHVFFALASTRFTDPSQEINLYAAADLASEQNLHVRIIGAADSATGAAGKNAELAIARAEYVMGLFKERGGPEEMIEIRSEGGTDKLKPDSANRNCRIELFSRK